MKTALVIGVMTVGLSMMVGCAADSAEPVEADDVITVAPSDVVANDDGTTSVIVQRAPVRCSKYCSVLGENGDGSLVVNITSNAIQCDD